LTRGMCSKIAVRSRFQHSEVERAI
jgi:hypothetical protein